jgi:hypothetical protein
MPPGPDAFRRHPLLLPHYGHRPGIGSSPTGCKPRGGRPTRAAQYLWSGAAMPTRRGTRWQVQTSPRAPSSIVQLLLSQRDGLPQSVTKRNIL